MGINRGTDRFLPTLNGNVLTAGGSLNLAKGQLGIFELKNNTKDGLKAVSTFAGAPRDREYEIRVGTANISVTRTQDNKSKSTLPFKLNEVVEVSVHAPSLEKSVDEFIVGYDGINPSTALTFVTGQDEELDIELSGEPIGVFGYNDSMANVKLYFQKDSDDQTNEEIVTKAIERLKETRLKENVPITEFIEVTPVNSEAADPSTGGVSHTFYNLNLTDGQGSNDLGEVQAQYNGDKVTVTGTSGMQTTYTILRPTSEGAPTDFNIITSVAQQGCEDCPDGYDTYTEGVLYSVTLEDDGVDLSTTVDNLPGFIAGSVIKQGQNGGIGSYTIVLDNKLTDGEIATFLSSNPTAIVEFIVDLEALCSDTVTTTASWVAGDVCWAQTEDYTIQLKDDDCGNDRLAELTAAYPELAITVVQAEDEDTEVEVTLTGTNGTANVNILGKDYLATFASTLTQTATNFVTAHEDDLLAVGVVVEAAGAVLTFTFDDSAYVAPTITNATEDLVGTIGEPSNVEGDLNGGCQTVYTTTVTTNIVCEECDNMFTDLFTSEPPHAYDMVEWTKVEPTWSETALMGIRIKAKELISAPTEELRDGVPFYNSSVRLRVAGGYITDNYLGLKTGLKRFNVKILSRQKELENLGGHLWSFEDRDFTYFNGYPRHRDDNGFANEYTKQLLGEESVLKANAQYVIYTVTIANKTSQGIISPNVEKMNYLIAAEVGRHASVESLVNKIAAAAGVAGVQAYGA